MRIKKRNYLILMIFLLLVSIITISSNAEETSVKNQTAVEQQAGICLNESIQFMKEMQENDFKINRINESLRQAQNLFNSQNVLKEKNKTYDFSLVLPYCDEIKMIRDSAFEARYEYEAFLKFYNESITSGMNTTNIELIISEIILEFQNERFEQVKPLVEKAYGETISVKSSYTALNIFYKATTKGIKQFFVDNWIYLCTAIIMITILFVVFRRPIMKQQIRRKIKALQLRKKTLKNLIMDTQRDYFTKGSVSEGIYNIRTKKFADLIRDIDRQIPLLEEEYIKLEKKIS